ncbi:hypothetical protein [Lysinibacillus sphaericus]|uniref:hypothetical protein n=1 Tax=Lysinibacillus sphaericus TaxID=1421 RepID=UPI0018CC80D6|nr:hypothetical protein [Lysinibacillus sphaericus]
MMSDMLLNFSEEVDLSLLDNLMENNDLSHLYYLANKEASTVNSRNEDKNKIEELSEKIRKKLESEN